MGQSSNTGDGDKPDTGDGTGDGGKPDPASSDGNGDKPNPDDGQDEKWQQMARKHERENRRLARELEELRKNHESDTDRQVREAREAGRTEALAEVTEELVGEVLRTEAATILEDPDAVALIPAETRAAFVTDGKPDRKAIRSAVQQLVNDKPYLAASGSKPTPLPGGGGTPSTGVSMNDIIRHKAGRP